MPQQSQERALVLLSGGQDSAVCLAWALDRFEHVETIGFDYGQRHRIELEQRLIVRSAIAALSPQWAGRLGDDRLVSLTGLGAIADTALTEERAFELAESGLPNSFVPARNLWFFAAAGGYAYRRDLHVLVGGMCETDFSGYPDCRREAIDAMQAALRLGMDYEVRIETPLMHLSKAQTWALAEELGGEALVEAVRLHTHSCYRGVRAELHDWGHGCGDCPACELRAKGWREWRRA